MIQQLRYQKARQAGEYKTAGDVWETMAGKGIGVFDKLPAGSAMPRERLLELLQVRYQTGEPEKVLAGLVRPPLLVPVHPLVQPILLQAQGGATEARPPACRSPNFNRCCWTRGWGTGPSSRGLVRQQISNQMQAESGFFYRRGVLSMLEGDIPAAKRRFLQSKRDAPKSWGVCPTSHTTKPNSTCE